MRAGKLKWWSADRGFGFILPDAGGPDMFVHFTDLKASGIDPDGVKVGVRLTFETGNTRDDRPKAINVCVSPDTRLVELGLKAKAK